VPSIEKYGRHWRDTDEVHVELACYRATRALLDFSLDSPGSPPPPGLSAAARGLLPPEEHLLLALRAMLPEKVFRISPWTRKRAWAFCHHRWHTQLGAGGCGKSTDMAAIVYADVLAHRECTTVKIYSTTKEALKNRIWKDVVKFHQCYPADMKYTPSTMRITYGAGDTINGIFGQGVLRDTGEIAVSNLVGVHNGRNICVADELQGTPEEVVKQTANQRIGGLFVFVGLGNPGDLSDTLCKYSTPWDGWKSVGEEDAEWVSRVGMQKKGYVLRFDGEKSPRILEPDGEKLYPFLIGRKDIEDIRDQFGPDSQEYWTQARGRPKTTTAHNTFLDPDIVVEKRLRDNFVFLSGTRTFAGFDPAFSAGGDRPFLSFARVGLTTEGFIGIQFLEEIDIKMNRVEGESLTDLLKRRVREECGRRGVTGNTFGMDCTGQETLADVLSDPAVLGPGIHRENFSNTASQDPVSDKDRRPGKKVFKDRTTELWHMMTSFARAGQVRGLSEDAITEFVARKFVILPDGRKKADEKKVVRAKLGRSPDNADSKVILLATIRKRMNLVPGARAAKRKMSRVDFEKLLPHNRRKNETAPRYSDFSLRRSS
jgi:hypothetical protein